MGRRRRKRRPVPSGTFPANIETLAHDARGIAHVDGKTIFVRDTLPGEEVLFSYTAKHSQYDEGRLDALITASPDRVTARCEHFGLCGGCSLQHLAANRQIEYKQAWLLENLARIANIIPPQVLPPLRGPHWAYRQKARLAVKFVYNKGRVLVGFRERDNPFVADINRCPVLHPGCGELLTDLAELIGRLSIYKRLPQIELAVGDEVTALSFRVLDTPSAEDIDQLKRFAKQHDLHIYLQPKGPDTCRPLWPEQTDLFYRLPEFDLDIAFLPHHFTQVNTTMNRMMIKQVMELLQPQADDDILDLFCGLGNFTLPIAGKAGQVTGIEGEQSLVDWAHYNAARNNIDNTTFIRANLYDDLVSRQAWSRKHYTKVVLDPPRSGALAVLPAIAATGAERIVYVSCHPATLARDAAELDQHFDYRLLSAGVMDMFPHTAHVESVALFERKRG